jgi:hypothetical protein
VIIFGQEDLRRILIKTHLNRVPGGSGKGTEKAGANGQEGTFPGPLLAKRQQDRQHAESASSMPVAVVSFACPNPDNSTEKAWAAG